MKNIIESSVIIKGIGPFESLTIFNSTDTTNPRYVDISKISGRKLSVYFKYTEGEDLTEKEAQVRLVIPTGLDEQGVKDYILTQIAQ